ncbi:MAG: tetratricopeptide repeat protein, partial [Ignavibacteriae bacterium]|nr:tetratricopeptide repeat protein [Ignavibacteriota bacterium]
STFVQAYVVLSDIENLRGNNTERTKLLQKALNFDERNVQALTLLAGIYLFDINEAAKGLTYLQKLQEIDPTDWVSNSDFGVGFAQLKDYPEAIRWFRQSLKLNPDQVDAWSNLGYAFERLAHYDSALECYNIANKKDPMNTLIYENLTSLLLATAKYSTAESLLLRGTKYLPSNHELIYDLGVTYELMGKPSNAKQTLVEGLRLLESKIQKNKTFSSHHADFGLFQARLRQPVKAIEAGSEAFRLDSTNNEVVMKIARMYAVLGKRDKVLEWYRRAKAMNPEYDAAYLTTALDFEKYRKDPDLLLLAREK